MEEWVSLVDMAREFAAKTHEGQMYGPDEPYTVHLDAVAASVEGDTAKAVAYLHDVVEDTPVTVAEVKARFGVFISECVALVTDGQGVNRKERKAATHAKLAKVTPKHHLALVVKTADRVANVEACVRKGNAGLIQMYSEEHVMFHDAVYRAGLCDELWDRIETALRFNWR